MTFEEWYEKYDRNIDIVNLIDYLQKVKPYTDEEIIEAIEKIKKIIIDSNCCGIPLTLKDIINLIVVNETCELK